MADDKTYLVHLTLEEWKTWQRLRQLVKSYATGATIVEWDGHELSAIRFVNKPEKVNL